MFHHRAVPYLQALSEGVIASHTSKLFGIGESAVEAQLRQQMNAMTNPTLAPYAKEGECELRVTAKAATQEEAQALLLPTVDQLKSPVRRSGLRGGRALPGVCGAGGASEGEGADPGHRRELHRRPDGQAAHRRSPGPPRYSRAAWSPIPTR